MGITIVGLGPGDGQLLTLQAFELLLQANFVYIRTNKHPAVKKLPATLSLKSFDHYYESQESFDQVYSLIVEDLLRIAREAMVNDANIIYAVPGHPMVGESTVTLLLHKAKNLGIEVEIIPGLSFIEPVLTALGIDALDGLQIFDAIEIAQFNHPPLNGDAPVLLAQVYNKHLANELKLTLMGMYPDEHMVSLVHEAGMENQLVEKVPLHAMDHSSRLAHLSSLFIPSLKNASSLTALAETVAFLRGPDGCPWDQEQTRHSLRAGFLEESSEVLEAIDNDDSDALREELGDVLYHLVMQAQIASEEGEFQLHDVIADIEKKLKRRHPHVWGDWQVDNTDEVIRNWEMLKKEEKKSGDENSSLLDNIPATLSALAQAQEVQERVKEVGFDWPDIAGVIAKVHEEILELQEASTNQTRQQEVGDLIFAIVNWCRWLDVNAETSLSKANRRFSQRFRQLEQISRDRGLLLSELDLNDLDKLWQESKERIDFDSEYDIKEQRKERADGRVPRPISGQGGRAA